MIDYAQMTIDGDENFITIYDDDVFYPNVGSPEYLFHFVDDKNVGAALAACKLIYGYENFCDESLKVMTGEVNDELALVLKEIGTDICYTFIFNNADDLTAAYVMAKRFCKLTQANEDKDNNADDGEPFTASEKSFGQKK